MKTEQWSEKFCCPSQCKPSVHQWRSWQSRGMLANPWRQLVRNLPLPLESWPVTSQGNIWSTGHLLTFSLGRAAPGSKHQEPLLPEDSTQPTCPRDQTQKHPERLPHPLNILGWILRCTSALVLPTSFRKKIARDVKWVSLNLKIFSKKREGQALVRERPQTFK